MKIKEVFCSECKHVLLNTVHPLLSECVKVNDFIDVVRGEHALFRNVPKVGRIPVNTCYCSEKNKNNDCEDYLPVLRIFKRIQNLLSKWMN